MTKRLEDVEENKALLQDWDILYSFDPQGATIEETKNARFVPGSQISEADLKNVKMISMVLKPGSKLKGKSKADFLIPIDADNHTDNFLTAVATTAISNSPQDTKFTEGNQTTFQLVNEYRVDGKVFVDQDKDGAYTGEQGLENYTIKLMNADGTPAVNKQGQEITATTDKE